jgi:hypothetical protein
MRVLCVRRGNKYGDEWVTRLRGMVARHLPIAHEFICLTETPIDGVICVPFVTDLPGYWAKIELFNPGRFDGDSLYLDLDVVVTASLEKLVRCLDGDRTRLWALDDFSYGLVNPKQGLGPDAIRFLGGAGTVNSSVMLWHGDAAKRVWTQFSPEVMQRLHGDQNHITQALWPDKINLIPPGIACSYRYHVTQGKSAPITVFHGIPKMDELPPKDALRRAWEAA